MPTRITHIFEELTPERRPQDPFHDGRTLTFETLEHGGEYPDTMPQAIKVIDAEGRWCIYVPIEESGKAVRSISFSPSEEPDVMLGEIIPPELVEKASPLLLAPAAEKELVRVEKATKKLKKALARKG